jgi:Outer membrane protein beta-barrel domain
MKKVTFFTRFSFSCLFLLAFFTTTMAQLNVKFGAKLGVNTSNISVKSLAPARSERIGFHVGVTSEISFTESLALQPDLMFSSQGFRLKVINSTENESFNYLNLTIPFAYKMNFVDVNFGPYVGYLLGNNLETQFTDFNGNQIFTSETISKFDMGLALGLTFHIKQFFVGTRYSLGLANVGKETVINGASVKLLDGKNAVGQLSVGYYF